MELRLGPLDEVEPEHWDDLVEGGDPFVSYGFLHSLEQQGCTSPETGWQPMHVRLHDDDRLVGAAPVYIKGHSHGEFIYDWHWAAAAERSGRDYYPKVFIGPPYTPATGPRLLGTQRDVLPAMITTLARQNGFSSVHVGCVSRADRQPFLDAGFLERRLWQYHWGNRGYRDFDDFLDALKRRKRKNIRQERKRAQAQGWRFERIRGRDATPEQWRRMALFQARTFADKGNWSTLNEAVFEAWRERLGDQTLLVLAINPDGEVAAGALFFQSETTLYGRYWGTIDETPFVHFETCYYQGIEYAIEKGLSAFEPGAQGTHKIARGFEPTAVSTLHWFADDALTDAVRRHLVFEETQFDADGEALRDLSAYP